MIYGEFGSLSTLPYACYTVRTAYNKLFVTAPRMNEPLIGMLGHNSAISSTGLGTTYANEMNFGMTHAPGAGFIA